LINSTQNITATEIDTTFEGKIITNSTVKTVNHNDIDLEITNLINSTKNITATDIDTIFGGKIITNSTVQTENHGDIDFELTKLLDSTKNMTATMLDTIFTNNLITNGQLQTVNYTDVDLEITNLINSTQNIIATEIDTTFEGKIITNRTVKTMNHNDIDFELTKLLDSTKNMTATMLETTFNNNLITNGKLQTVNYTDVDAELTDLQTQVIDVKDRTQNIVATPIDTIFNSNIITTKSIQTQNHNDIDSELTNLNIITQNIKPESTNTAQSTFNGLVISDDFKTSTTNSINADLQKITNFSASNEMETNLNGILKVPEIHSGLISDITSSNSIEMTATTSIMTASNVKVAGSFNIGDDFVFVAENGYLKLNHISGNSTNLSQPKMNINESYCTQFFDYTALNSFGMLANLSLGVNKHWGSCAKYIAQENLLAGRVVSLADVPQGYDSSSPLFVNYVKVGTTITPSVFPLGVTQNTVLKDQVVLICTAGYTSVSTSTATISPKRGSLAFCVADQGLISIGAAPATTSPRIGAVAQSNSVVKAGDPVLIFISSELQST
jgi:hypothetical protein